MTTPVPPDFPFEPTSGSLSGAQLKFSVVRDIDGVFREAGASLGDHERDYAFCLEVVKWGVELLQQKIAKPKYAGLPKEALLGKLDITLQRNFDMPTAYRAWVLEQVACRFDCR